MVETLLNQTTAYHCLRNRIAITSRNAWIEPPRSGSSQIDGGTDGKAVKKTRDWSSSRGRFARNRQCWTTAGARQCIYIDALLTLHRFHGRVVRITLKEDVTFFLAGVACALQWCRLFRAVQEHLVSARITSAFVRLCLAQGSLSLLPDLPVQTFAKHVYTDQLIKWNLMDDTLCSSKMVEHGPQKSMIFLARHLPW